MAQVLASGALVEDPAPLDRQMLDWVLPVRPVEPVLARVVARELERARELA